MTPRHLLQTAAAVLAMTAALTALAQNQDRDRERQREQQRQQDREKQKQNQRDQDFIRLSHISGASIQTQDGKNIGKIENLAIDPRSGQVLFAIVDVRGASELSNKRNLAIPIRALQFTGEQQARLKLDMQRLKDAPEFDPSGWDTIGNLQWGRRVHEFYGIEMNVAAKADRDDQNGDRITLVKATDLKDARIQARGRENLGEVEDFFVDVNRGFIAFAAVKLDKGQAAQGDRLVAVPWPVVNFNRNDGALVLTIEPERLRDAPAIERNDWKNVNADFTRRVYSHFDVKPDQVYGYVPPRNGDDDDRNGNQDRWGGGGSGGNWHPDSPYGQKFNVSNVQTIRGRVQSIQRFKPMSDMAEGVRMTVQTEDNQAIEVHLGPAWFIERQQMQFQDGENVRVIGSRVQIDGKPVIMASEVWRGDRVLLLRNRHGLPIWDAWRSADQLTAEESSRDRNGNRD